MSVETFRPVLHREMDYKQPHFWYEVSLRSRLLVFDEAAYTNMR